MKLVFIHLLLTSVNKCGGTCNTIDDPYAEVCIPNKVKNMNIKVFNLMSGVKWNKVFSST